MKRTDSIKEIVKNNPKLTDGQVKEHEGKIYQMVWKLFRLYDKHLSGDMLYKMRDEFEATIKEYGYDLYDMYYDMSKEDWIKEVNTNIERCQTEQGKIKLLNELLRMHNGRMKANECGLGEWFEKEIKIIRDKYKADYNISFDELSVLGFDGLTYQEPVTLGEARAQVLWLHSKCSTGINDLEIKRHLKMYFPNWTNEQIEDGVNEIKIIISREEGGEKTKQAIASYLTLHI